MAGCGPLRGVFGGKEVVSSGGPDLKIKHPRRFGFLDFVAAALFEKGVELGLAKIRWC